MSTDRTRRRDRPKRYPRRPFTCWKHEHHGACCCNCANLAVEKHWLTMRPTGSFTCTAFADLGEVMSGLSQHGLCEIWTPRLVTV